MLKQTKSQKRYVEMQKEGGSYVFEAKTNGCGG